jgi:hypothetical protein
MVSPSFGQFHARGLVSLLAYSTVRASGAVCPWGGLGYYEIEILSAASGTQFGFCIPGWPAARGICCVNGVGDEGLSWGVDGDRVIKWHQGPKGPFGGRWREGDVVGLACDLRAEGSCRMLVSLNGDFSPPYGVAFDLPAVGLESGLCPAFTAWKGVFRCNLVGDSAGQGRPFRYPPPSLEYRAMAAAGAAV